MLQSNTTFYLRDTISQALTVLGTFNISNDTELWLPIDTDGEIVSIVFKSDRQIERMTVTIADSVCTVVTRGIEQSGWTPNVGLQKQWNEWVLGYITALDFDIIDKDGDSNTISADNTFSWDNNFKKITFNSTVDAGLEVNSLTTAERTALTPVNGSIVYDETLGQLYMYIWASWASIDTGTATPNMSETVNGTWEIATASERGAWTSVWGTGARLVVSNDALKKTSAGASDENKIPVLNASGKVDAFVSNINSKTEESTITNWDFIWFYDTSAWGDRKIDYEDLQNSINNSHYATIVTKVTNSITTTTITHSLWKTPQIIRLSSTAAAAATAWTYSSWVYTHWDSNSKYIWRQGNTPYFGTGAIILLDGSSDYLIGTIWTNNSTTTTINWAKTGNPNNTAYVLIEFST